MGNGTDGCMVGTAVDWTSSGRGSGGIDGTPGGAGIGMGMAGCMSGTAADCTIKGSGSGGTAGRPGGAGVGTGTENVHTVVTLCERTYDWIMNTHTQTWMSVPLCAALMAACSSYEVIPDRVTTSTTSSGSGGAGGGNARGGGGANEEPFGFASGERLRVRYYEGSDGSRQPLGLYDTQQNVLCQPKGTATGVRCIPVSEPGEYSYGGYFANDTCTQPAIAVPAGCSPPQYAVVSIQQGSACSPSYVTVREVEAQIGVVYGFAGDACTVVSTTNHSLYSLGPDITTQFELMILTTE